jgi:hypothetical protein
MNRQELQPKTPGEVTLCLATIPQGQSETPRG